MTEESPFSYYQGSVIPPKYRDLFEKKAFANLATIMLDGSPPGNACLGQCGWQ